MQVLTTRQTWWAAQCEAVLAAEGVPAFWEAAEGQEGTLCLEVSEPYVAQAVELLSAQLGEDIERAVLAAEAAAGHVEAPLLLRPAVATGLGMAALQLVMFAVVGGVDDHSRWFERGALLRAAVVHGAWWRLLTASMLHADIPHICSNAAFFVVLSWAAGEHLGSGLALATWLLTAVAGFVTSLLFSDVQLTVGASGGLFGLLGAAAGHALRWAPRKGTLAFRRQVQIFGSATLLLAFTAFSHEANVYAHVAGFVAGLAVGVFASAKPAPAWAQAGAAGIVGLALVAAWARALR